ncbi:MAG: hypothetical protein VXX26_10605, partial [Pseudomonadota bacterium]|nr:hypothetical protein [Pseudomonadota bacterium]
MCLAGWELDLSHKCLGLAQLGENGAHPQRMLVRTLMHQPDGPAAKVPDYSIEKGSYHEQADHR